MFLVSQGVIQNFNCLEDVTTLEATAYQQPKVGADGQPMDDKGAPVMEDEDAETGHGPCRIAGSHQDAGTNGGGFFNANSRTRMKTRRR